VSSHWSPDMVSSFSNRIELPIMNSQLYVIVFSFLKDFFGGRGEGKNWVLLVRAFGKLALQFEGLHEMLS
jgi:hypothetical protein